MEWSAGALDAQEISQTPQQFLRVPWPVENSVGKNAMPLLLTLNRKNRFHEFLRKELTASKTEVEKEVVMSELLKTGIEIEELKKELRLVS